ncbi:hypothetical protein [Pseudaminobacter soli (ex Li et al. 2025)]|uniref:hypothetical protein n=1 Tax=Pseudaminobacter soli (ex Li et al. 2025) TaxID=1295366 RepID=UPI0011B203D4|nr:hypothetical protein [Mesorhizobium soli]
MPRFAGAGSCRYLSGALGGSPVPLAALHEPPAAALLDIAVKRLGQGDLFRHALLILAHQKARGFVDAD